MASVAGIPSCPLALPDGCRIKLPMRIEVLFALLACIAVMNVAIVVKTRIKSKEDKMKFATRYTPPPSPSFQTVGKSRTRQEFKSECDINCILAKMGAGLLAPCVSPEPVYSDLDAVPRSYEECLKVIMDAQDEFAALPSKVRDYFGNDPAKMLDFLGKPENRDEAIRLGLIAKPLESVTTDSANKAAKE